MRSYSTLHTGAEVVREDDYGQLDSGVTKQMADLTLSSSSAQPIPWRSTAPKPYMFGDAEEFDFDFKLPAACKAWPFPPYDKQSLYAPGVIHKPRPARPKTRAKFSKRKLSHDGKQTTRPGMDRPNATIVKDEARTKKVVRPLQYYGVPRSREPPPHLLNLPGEIRNQIYRLVCVHSEPIVAQFRPIIKPRAGVNNDTSRRFPFVPAVAMTCRQLQKEVLSMFYGENKFVFRQSEKQKLKHLAMTRPDMMEKWSPKFGFADALTHVELQFNAKSIFVSKISLNYTFRKLSDGQMRVSTNSHELHYCTCFDTFLLWDLQEKLEAKISPGDLISEARAFVISRAQQLRSDESMTQDGAGFTLCKHKCDDCGLSRLLELENGLDYRPRGF